LLRETLGKVPPLYRLANRIRGIRIHEPDVRLAYQFIGSWYGGWTLPEGALDSSSVVYSAGVGEDISFDLGIIDATGCVVHGFDPTPIALDWIARQPTPHNYIFHNMGLAEADGEMEFFVPDDSHSFSREPGRAGSTSVKCPVRRLGSIMAELGHDRIDLLKMDIEGFEFAVLDDMVAEGILPRVINVEFHHGYFGITADQTRAAVEKLKAAGYRLYWVSDLGREYGFIRD
jgi:FkbM family methyltransferase